MKAFKSTGFLLGVVVFLGLYTYFFEYQAGIEEERQKSETARVLKVPADQITSVSIKSGAKEVELKKEEGQWHLKQPIIDLADSSEMEQFVKTLSVEKQKKEVVSGENIRWNIFGLDQPAGMVEVKTAKTTYQLHISNKKNFEGNYYLRVGDEKKVRLVDAQWKSWLERTPLQFREKKVVRKIVPAVQKIQFHSKAKLNFERVKDQWQITNRRDWKVDQGAVDSFLAKLNQIKATQYVSETSDPKDQRKYGLRRPFAKITMEGGTEGREKLELHFGKNKAGDLFVVNQRRPMIAKIDKSFSADLEKKPSDFRDKKAPFIFEQEKVNEIDVNTGLAKLKLTRKEGDWTLAYPQEKNKEVDIEKVKSLLNSLSELRAKEFLGTQKGRGLAPPKNQIVLRSSEGKPVFELAWGEKYKKKDKSLFFVKTNMNSETMGVEDTKLLALPAQTLIKEKKDDEKGAKAPAKKDEKS